PSSKLSEDKDNYYVEIDLPGIKKEEIKIEVEENTLRVQGERKEKKRVQEAKQHFSEVFHGTFTREFLLPAAIEKEGIKARYEEGILIITVPKSSKSKAHQVYIE
ncbi:HSP20-like chaperone, partial [Glomus cerebriforme]